MDSVKSKKICETTLYCLFSWHFFLFSHIYYASILSLFLILLRLSPSPCNCAQLGILAYSPSNRLIWRVWQIPWLQFHCARLNARLVSCEMHWFTLCGPIDTNTQCQCKFSNISITHFIYLLTGRASTCVWANLISKSKKPVVTGAPAAHNDW